MNNKILARIVAAVMAVTMLGTVSFAELQNTTNVNPSEYETGSTADALNAQTTRTVLAVKTTNATTYPNLASISDDDILDVQQLTGTAGNAYNATLNIDETRLGETRYVAVYFGGNNGVVGKTIIEAKASAKSPVLKKIDVFTDITIGDKKYTNLVGATYEYTAQAAETVTRWGIKLGKYTTDEDANETVAAESGVAILANDTDVQLNAGGKIKFTGIVYGVEKATGVTIKGRGFVEFE